MCRSTQAVLDCGAVACTGVRECSRHAPRPQEQHIHLRRRAGHFNAVVCCIAGEHHVAGARRLPLITSERNQRPHVSVVYLQTEESSQGAQTTNSIVDLWAKKKVFSEMPDSWAHHFQSQASRPLSFLFSPRSFHCLVTVETRCTESSVPSAPVCCVPALPCAAFSFVV